MLYKYCIVAPLRSRLVPPIADDDDDVVVVVVVVDDVAASTLFVSVPYRTCRGYYAVSSTETSVAVVLEAAHDVFDPKKRKCPKKEVAGCVLTD